MKLDLNKSHGKENNEESETNYNFNIKALNNNCRILLEQLLTGNKLTGYDCARLGILEYRKRFDDLKKIHKIPIQDDYVYGKRFKAWWLDKSYINNLKLN